MLPARRPLKAENFFGKSYPRAIGTLGDENKLIKASDAPQLPNAPFLHWAGTHSWERGGTAAHWKGKAPKEAITAFEAYKLYLQSHPAADTAPPEKGDSADKEPVADAAAQEEPARDDAAERWKALAPAERAIFEDLAREDAKRFLEQATHFETLNPGWFQRRGEAPPPRAQPGRRLPKAGSAPRAARKQPPPPRPAMTPWDALLKHIVETSRQRNPKAFEGMTPDQVQATATEQGRPIWAQMTDHKKTEFVQAAAEDQARFEAEVAEAAAQRKERHAASKAARALAKLSAGKGKQRPGKAGAEGAPSAEARRPRKAAARKADAAAAAAKEAMEKVDVSGLNPMQAWAARQRAAKKAAAAAAPRRTTRSKAAASAAAAAAEEPNEARMARLSVSEAPARAAPGVAAAVGARSGLARCGELPDEAYIRSRATADEEDDDDEDADEDSDDSELGLDDISSVSGAGSGDDMDAEVDAVEATPLEEDGPSQIPDSQPATQAGEAGVLGRMRSALMGGLGWLTAGRKRRGLFASMQDVPTEGQPVAADAELGRRAEKALGNRRVAATPRRLEPSLGAAATSGDACSLEAGPSSAAKRRRQAK